MFRIKTDIRQYKCETRDKVEKLIRNWVIRPNDLIYHADHKEWHPIGEHPAFVGLFGMLEQAEKNTPDTVVTARNPYAPKPTAIDESAPPDDDVDEDSRETTEEDRQDVPSGVDSTEEEGEEKEGEDALVEGDSPAEADVDEGEGPDETSEASAKTDEVERSELRLDGEVGDVAPGDEPSDEEPDEAPETTEEQEEAEDEEAEDEEAEEEEADEEEEEAEEEPEDDPDDEPEDEDVAPEETEEDRETEERLRETEETEESKEAEESEEEVTQLVERPEFEDSEEIVDESETTEDSRETDVFDQDEIAKSLTDEPEPPAAPEGVEPPSNDEVTMMTEKTLEMLKITDENEAAEVSGDEDEEEVTDVRDRPDTTDDDEEREPTVIVAEDAEDTGDAEKSKPKADAAPKLGRHDLPEELFATNEISSPQVQEKLKKLDELGELSEPSEPDPEATPNDPPMSPPRAALGLRLQEDSGVDEAWQEISADLRETGELDEEDVASSEIPADLLRETDEIEQALAEESGETEESDGWEEDDDEAPVIAVEDFVSDGYKIPLPFPPRPTAEDMRLGLRSTKVSRRRRDRTYPTPQPKKPDEVQHRQFDLSPRPPRDGTIVLLFGIVIVIGLITMIASTC